MDWHRLPWFDDIDVDVVVVEVFEGEKRRRIIIIMVLGSWELGPGQARIQVNLRIAILQGGDGAEDRRGPWLECVMTIVCQDCVNTVTVGTSVGNIPIF